MKHLVIFLVLTSFIISAPSVFGECVSLHCDDANVKLEESNYQFVDFSYQNKVGEPITFILEKTAKNQCDSYIATITDENGEVVWSQERESLCVTSDQQKLWTSQIKLGFDAENQMIPRESAKYLLKVQIDDGSIEREFVARNTTSSISLDRIVYLVPSTLSPLKQFQSGISIEEIHCGESLILVVKHDVTPVCMTPETADKMMERGWGISYESLIALADNSDAIITGMVVGEDLRPNGERHVWLSSYE